MSRPGIKPKERRKVTIPENLREALRDVHELLQDQTRNGGLPIDYDDAIQIGPLCGGHVGTRARPYVFRYRRTGAGLETWSLTLHRTEIEDIADGQMTEILLYCCTSTDCANKFREPDGWCPGCDSAAGFASPCG